MPTNHLGRLSAIVVVLLIALAAIFPLAIENPKKFLSPSVPFSSKHNLKPGIDMVGGTSLLYEIKPPDGPYSTELSQQVMEALKKRVDPDGVRNLVWRPQGATRLEIQMPLSGKSEMAKDAREEFGNAQKNLEATNVRLGTVVDAVERLSGDARIARLTALAMDSATRKQVFFGLASAHEEKKKANERRDAAAEGAAAAKIEELEPKVETTNINMTDLDSALTAIEEAKKKQSESSSAAGPSADALALIEKARARAKDFPTQLAALDAYIKAHENYAKLKDQLDDAADLKRLLQGSGVLEYHILVANADPRVPEMLARLEQGFGTNARSGDTCKWAMVDKGDEFKADGVIRKHAGHTWVLIDLRPEKSMTASTGNKWVLKDARSELDQQSGDQHVRFDLDQQGGVYMGRLTGANIGKPMAIVLDNKVISAPNVQSQINDSGIITGHYSNAEITYLVSTLRAGSLPAQVADQPISERTVGPQLGADNLRSGLMACGFGLIVVGTFLIGYYYLAGIVAFFAVCLNLILIIGALAALNATFTLPGVAALVLTLGTAVDANVLVFERLREEQLRGFPLRTAIRNAYDRAFTAIWDSNFVTAIVSLVLYVFGSEEVKGFGLTLLIGIVASLFTALFVTKTVFAILIDRGHVKRLGSIPMSIPTWDRLLKPHIDWMGKAWLLFGASMVFCLAGLGLFVHYIHKGEMFDIEFSSGTSVTLDFKQSIPIDQVRETLTKAGPTEVLVAGTGATSGGTTTQPIADRRVKVEEAIPSPSIVAVGSDGKSYEIVTPNVDVPAVRAAIFDTYKDVLKVELPSTFARVGVPVEQAMGSVIYPVEMKPPVGVDGKPRFVPEQIGEYRGGVAIYLDGINPPLSPKEIASRITNQRLQPGGSARSLPPIAVFSPGGSQEKATSEAVVLAVDPKILADEDKEKWQGEIAEPIWKLINEAVNRPPSLAKVSNFDAQVAGETQQSALMALTIAILIIMVYVWIRFGSLKYGWANTVALLHDTFFIIGALGFAHLICGPMMPTAVKDFAEHVLKIEPFRLNLTVVAGILTIMGYSMVDTIVVFDRIREIRGQRGMLTRQVVNDALNQTLSRTLLTAGTTVATLFVMYMFGGPGIHGFTYVLLVGIVVGTYSSIAIAAPVLLIGMGKAGDAATPPKGGEVAGTQLQRA